ncbi:MAG: glycosyltransferase family 9 protein [Anaerolineae bacterium]
MTARSGGQPGGRAQPGMVMDAKRYPPEQLAALANRLVPALGASVVLIGGRGDEALVEACGSGWTRRRRRSSARSASARSWRWRGARLYLGNDTGLTHLAAAAGAKTVMILVRPIRRATPCSRPTRWRCGSRRRSRAAGWSAARPPTGTGRATASASTPPSSRCAWLAS